MPLKPDDLKTIDTYKKAMKMDVSKINQGGNTKFWIYRDVELPTASGGTQKLPVFFALIDNHMVLPAPPLKGKNAACRGKIGLVRLDGKDYIEFEFEQAAIDRKLLPKSVSLLLGKPLYDPSSPGGEDEEEEGAEEQAAPAGGTDMTRLNAAWNNMFQRARQIVAADPSRKNDFAQAADGIPALLSSGDAREAQARMARFAKLLEVPAAPQGGFAQYRNSLMQFTQARTVVKGQIGALRSKILAEFPGESELANELTNGLEEISQRVAGAVDEAMKAAANQAAPVTDAVRQKIRLYLGELAGNLLVKQADTNPMGVPVTIAKTFGEALARIQHSMPA
jgi:hypothetical protein